MNTLGVLLVLSFEYDQNDQSHAICLMKESTNKQMHINRRVNKCATVLCESTT